MDEAFAAVSKPSVTPAGVRRRAMYDALPRQLDDIADAREEILAAHRRGAARFLLGDDAGVGRVGMESCDVDACELVARRRTCRALVRDCVALSFVIIIDQPFDGDASVKPTPINEMVAMMARIG